MFSDFKSRGFGIEDTQLRYADRLDRLILVMALALYGRCPPASGTPFITQPRAKKTRTAKLTWRRHIELPACANKLPDLV